MCSIGLVHSNWMDWSIHDGFWQNHQLSNVPIQNVVPSDTFNFLSMISIRLPQKMRFLDYQWQKGVRRSQKKSKENYVAFDLMKAVHLTMDIIMRVGWWYVPKRCVPVRIYSGTPGPKINLPRKHNDPALIHPCYLHHIYLMFTYCFMHCIK